MAEENHLFPLGIETEQVTINKINDKNTMGYRGGIAFDNRHGDFLCDGMDKIMDCSGIESWKSWCINCMETERLKYLGYSSDFGISTAEAFRARTREEAEAILTREITEAILADPYKRGEYVENITFSWAEPDSLTAAVTIHGIENVTIDITANITKGGR